MNVSSPTKLSFEDISCYHVLDELYYLDNSKAPGYNISINLIKNCTEILYVPLTYIFNTSIRKSVFPDLLKLAEVCPIDKGGEQQSVTNYRPISLLPLFANVFEKIISHALTKHLEENNLLYSYEFGFRKQQGTSTAILDFMNRIQLALDRGEIAQGLFLEFEFFEFDTIDHSILLGKRLYYGIQDNEESWFRSYLSKRKQFVSINGTDSDLLEISTSVPQGSILGPILFLIYVNNAQFISRLIHLVLYADDMNILVSHKHLSIHNEERTPNPL